MSAKNLAVLDSLQPQRTPMLYLLGGAARSGKSAIAERFLAETRIPYFCLDYLMMGFANGLPAYGVNPDDDELHVAELLWPVTRSMAVAMVENEIDYLLEGVQLHPRHARELDRMFPGQVRVCFVGYADVDTRVKFHHIRRFGGRYNDWLNEYDDQDVLRTIERLKILSKTLRDECQTYGLKYIETSTGFEHAILSVVQYLLDKES